MNDEKRQQALDNLRNALSRCEQSGFDVAFRQFELGFNVFVYDAELHPDPTEKVIKGISNHTLRIKFPK